MIRGGETVKTGEIPAPALDKLRRPTVDNSGVVAGIGRLAAASKMPELPMELAKPYEALGTVGKAITRTGSILGAVAAKRQDAETFTQSFEADMEMGRETQRQLEFQEANKHDPNSWEPNRVKGLADLQKKYEGREDLTPDAQQVIGRKIQVYDQESKRQTFVGSTKQTFRRAQGAMDSVLETAIKNNDKPQFEANLKLGEQSGLFYEDQSKRYRDKWDEQRKQDKVDELYASAQRDPDDLKKFLLEQEDGKFTNATELSTSQRNALLAEADSVTRGKVQDTGATVADNMANGTITTVEQLRPFLVELRPGDAKEVEEQFLKVQGLKVNRDNLRPEVWQPRWLELRRQIEDFDATAVGADARYLSIEQNLEVLPTDQQGVLRTMIRGKYDSGHYDAETSLKAYGKGAIHQAHEDQLLGQSWRKRATAADDATAMGLLATSADPKKDAAVWMKQIGISKEDAEAIKAAPDARAKMLLFQTAWEGLDKKDRDEAVAKFPITEREKIARLLKNPDIERVDTDHARESRSAQRAAELNLSFDAWFESMKAKGPVTKTMVDTWYAKETGASMRPQQINALLGRPTSSRAPLPPGTVPAPSVAPEVAPRVPPKTTAKEEKAALDSMTKKQREDYEAAQKSVRDQGIEPLTKAQQDKEEEEMRLRTNTSAMPTAPDSAPSGGTPALLPFTE
jgi:hypothetical protein